MNNTRILAAIAAILITAAALVVGGRFSATSAFAYQKKGGQQKNSKMVTRLPSRNAKIGALQADEIPK
jgi:hypothetical protein